MPGFVMPVLLVQDVQESVAFYQQLFELRVAFDVGAYVVFENAFALWQRDNARGLMQDTSPPPATAGKDTELCFETADIEAFAATLRKRKDISLLHDLKTEPWGQRTVRLHDLDGFVVEVAESMDDVARRLLRDGLGAEEVQLRTMMPLERIENLAQDI